MIWEGRMQEEYIKFAQEKYSNGETSLQYFEEYLKPNALYLLDEPEVSLSPENQVALAEEINKMASIINSTLFRDFLYRFFCVFQ